MSVAYQKFNAFVADAANGVHHMATDQIKIALTAVSPVATNAVLADLTEISYTNLSTRNITTTSSTQTSGLYKYIAADLVLTASGAVAGFRYVVIYNSTPAAGNLIGFYDYGSTVTLASGDNFTVDFDNVNGVLTLQ